MKIEILYRDLATFYGEDVGLRYLKMCLPQAQWIETRLSDAPAFTREKVDMVYMGPMTERSQELVIKALTPYAQSIVDYIDSGALFFAVGNAFEVFGKHIENEDGSKINCLGIFDTYAKRKMLDRFNCLYMGKFEDITVVGFKAQFTHSYALSEVQPLFEDIKGCGLNPQHKGEGIRRKNFMGTYVLGPIFVNCPDFTKHIMKLLGVENPTLPFEKEVYESYNARLKEFQSSSTDFYY